MNIAVATGAELPRPALLLDLAALRVAPAGAGIGLTGRFAPGHVEELLMTARHGRPLDTATVSSARPSPGARGGGDVLVPIAVRGPKEFIDDVFATFYFCGSRANFFHVFVSVAACTLILFAATLFPSKLPALIIMLLQLTLYGAAILFAAQFYWRVLSVTAGGDDEMPLVAPVSDFWGDTLRPTIMLVLVTIVCAAPALLIRRDIPPTTTGYAAMLVAAGLLGSFFWPMAVLATGVSNRLAAARPDLVLRSIVRIGWPYLVAWAAVVVTIMAWIATYAYRARVAATPFAGPGLLAITQTGLAFYYGYAVFRILGLLYRHYETRLAWQ